MVDEYFVQYCGRFIWIRLAVRTRAPRPHGADLCSVMTRQPAISPNWKTFVHRAASQLCCCFSANDISSKISSFPRPLSAPGWSFIFCANFPGGNLWEACHNVVAQSEAGTDWDYHPRKNWAWCPPLSTGVCSQGWNASQPGSPGQYVRIAVHHKQPLVIQASHEIRQPLTSDLASNLALLLKKDNHHKKRNFSNKVLKKTVVTNNRGDQMDRGGNWTTIVSWIDKIVMKVVIYLDSKTCNPLTVPINRVKLDIHAQKPNEEPQ